MSFESIPLIQIVITLLIPFGILLSRWVTKKVVLNLAHVKGVPKERGIRFIVILRC